jgi:hypothetical protein
MTAAVRRRLASPDMGHFLAKDHLRWWIRRIHDVDKKDPISGIGRETPSLGPDDLPGNSIGNFPMIPLVEHLIPFLPAVGFFFTGLANLIQAIRNRDR